jgi:hypothetical protein
VGKEEYELIQKLADMVTDKCKDLCYTLNNDNIDLPDSLGFEFTFDGGTATVQYDKIRPMNGSEISKVILDRWRNYYINHKDIIPLGTYRSIKGHIKRHQFEVFINYCKKHKLDLLNDGKLNAMMHNNCILDGSMTIKFSRTIPISATKVCINIDNSMKILSKE